MASVDGWYIFTRGGKLAIGEHIDVDKVNPVLTIFGCDTNDHPCNIVENSIRFTPGPPPVWRYTLNWKKYGITTTFDEEEFIEMVRDKHRKYRRRIRRKQYDYLPPKLADSLNPEVIEDWAHEFRKTTPSERPTVRSYFRDAVDREMHTHLTDETEVQTLSDEMIARDSRIRTLASFSIRENQFKVFPGDVVTIVHDRFNLSPPGKRGRVISVVEDSNAGFSQMQVLIYD